MQSKTGNSFTTSQGQADVQPSPGKQGSVTHTGYLGRQTSSDRMSPPSFPQLFLLRMMLHDMGCPFGQLGSAVPAVSQPSFLCTPSPLADGVV